MLYLGIGPKMGKRGNIELYFKRQRTESVEEDPPPPPEQPVPLLLELEPGQENTDEEPQANEAFPDPIVFRGAEFLERDPALRPQIWRYPPNQRDSVRRAYLMLGPMQPQLTHYEGSGKIGHQRRFRYNWFSLFPSWLEYSQHSHRAYCLFCFVSSKNILAKGGSDVFSVHGFDKWKKVNDGKSCAFLGHVGSGPCSPHNNAVTECQALMNQPGHLENVVAAKDMEKVSRNRLRLKASVAAVRWLTFQACAFRGHDEKVDSKNKGNFLELLELPREFNPDLAKVILGNSPYNSKYTCPEIQKEILSIYASKVRKHIREEIGDSKFSILVDETCDVAKREQMALVFRFVDKNGCSQERFFDLIHVPNTKAVTLKDELCSVLSNYGFDIQNLRGQGYDGASNMRGELNGLQSLFLKVCPYAYYVHCYAHRLQLALVDASKEVVPVAQFFQKLVFIINTVDSSSKRHDELHDAQLVELMRMIESGHLQTGQGENQIRSLKRPGDTRWGSHFGSILSLMELFNAVNFVIQEMAADRSVAGQIRADADTSFGYMSSFEFVFVLCMMKEILEITEGLGQALQLRSQDITNAVRLVLAAKQCLRELRSDEGWEEFFCTVVEFCVNHGTEIPDLKETYIMRGGRARHQPDHFTKERYFRVEVFRGTIDCQLHELDRRFSEKIMDLLSTSATLIPRNRFKSFKGSHICELVKKYYPADFTQQDLFGLEQQLKPFVVDASNDEELKNISTLTELCHCLVETRRDTIYNLIVRLLQLLVTLPVSTASAERAFSSLKIIKTRLRNKMEDENLSNNLLVHIEREIAEKYNFEAILTEFKTKTRRADL